MVSGANRSMEVNCVVTFCARIVPSKIRTREFTILSEYPIFSSPRKLQEKQDAWGLETMIPTR